MSGKSCQSDVQFLAELGEDVAIFQCELFENHGVEHKKAVLDENGKEVTLTWK